MDNFKNNTNTQLICIKYYLLHTWYSSHLIFIRTLQANTNYHATQLKKLRVKPFVQGHTVGSKGAGPDPGILTQEPEHLPRTKLQYTAFHLLTHWAFSTGQIAYEPRSYLKGTLGGWKVHPFKVQSRRASIHLWYPQVTITFSSVQFSRSVMSDSLWPHEP